MKPKLKIGLCGGLVAACVTPHVYAQSSVTLYGLIESALVSQNHASPGGGHVYSLNQAGEGFLSASRIGFLGSEELGGGMKARFVLENGFTVNNGKFDQQGQLFGRQAFVGLAGNFGEVDFGRQYNGAVVAISMVDPLFIGAPPTNSWLVFLTGQRDDNTISYTKKFGPVGVNFHYSPGGIAGSWNARSSTAGGLSYEDRGIVATAEFQQTHDSQSRSAKTWSVGGKYDLGAVKLYGDYLQSQRDAGFDVTNGGTDTGSITNMSTAATPTTVAAIGSVFSAARRDQFATLGASYNFTPAFQLLGVFMWDLTSASNFSGSRKTGYAVADYLLSKRTDVYFAAAYERVNGDWSGLFGTTTTNWTGGSGVKLNGASSQTSYYVGLRHRF
ncbi:porin [Paraburkholderia fungorum]|uniref:porin n=1 Tax=Paraburkholderia fungorum TaxID=134537 RepID=UPI0038BB86FC